MNSQDDGNARPAGGGQRRLDRAPGDRYRNGARASGGASPVAPGAGPVVPLRAVTVSATVALAGSLLFFALGQLDLGPGLLAVAAFAGWIAAVALVGPGAFSRPGPVRIITAAILAVVAIALAMGLDWAWALAQSGVLGPLDYVAQRYGPTAILDLGIAGAVAALRAR